MPNQKPMEPVTKSTLAIPNVKVERLCHICIKQPTRNLNFSICDECREAILFAKELRKAAVNHVKSSKM